VLDELTDQRYQSDERFVEMFVRSKAERGQGPVRIGHELREKGVAAELIEAALDASAAHWIERARAALNRKFSGEVTDFPERAKRMRFLEYRGFTHKHISAALKGGDDE
jgi:regulatory protein